MLADIVIAVANVAMAFGLIWSIATRKQVELSLCVVNAVALYSIGAATASLDLFVTAMVTIAVGILWSVLTLVQVRSPWKR